MHSYRLRRAFDHTVSVPMAASHYAGWLETLPRHDIVAEEARRTASRGLGGRRSALLDGISVAVPLVPQEASPFVEPEHLHVVIPHVVTRRD